VDAGLCGCADVEVVFEWFNVFVLCCCAIEVEEQPCCGAVRVTALKVKLQPRWSETIQERRSHSKSAAQLKIQRSYKQCLFIPGSCMVEMVLIASGNLTTTNYMCSRGTRSPGAPFLCATKQLKS
jgi:hypothetical protein